MDTARKLQEKVAEHEQKVLMMSGFMGSINAGDLFTNEEIDTMEPKMARRIVRHMSASNKTVRLWFKLIFTGLELLLASNYITLCSSAPIFSNPSRVTLKLFGVHIPSFFISTIPWFTLAAQLLVAFFLIFNSHKRQLFFLLYFTTIFYVLAGVPLLLLHLQTDEHVSQVFFYVCVAGTVISILTERASYRADQGLYELKRTVMESNKTRSEK